MINMNDTRIRNLVEHFRTAIEKALNEGILKSDYIFKNFPKACCGDTCYILAEFLLSQGIETIYVWGDYEGQSHAWLVVKDKRVKQPTQRVLKVPNEIKEVLDSYGCCTYNGWIDNTHYVEKDLLEGLIIDITADQFGEIPVYVDYIDDFHRKFKFESAHDYKGMGNSRLRDLYKKIILEK